MTVLYESHRAIAVLKPAGVLSQPNDEPRRGAPSLLEQVSDYLGKPAFLVHRLDSGVGGVMVFAKTKDSAAALSEAIRDGSFIKEYIAVCEGIPAGGTMTDHLARDGKRGITRVAKPAEAGAKYAELSYEPIRIYETDYGDSTLVRIRLVTGRTHQIRAQFSSRGHALLGDKRYGSRDGGCGIALYAIRVAFPDGGRTVEVTAPEPTGYPWE